jgi:hypothetical protein
MTTRKPELEDLQARLQSSEGHDRWLRVIGVLILILAGAGLLMGGQGPPQDETVIAQRFILRDLNGQERAWLGLVDGRPVLCFLSGDGRDRADLQMADTGIILRVGDPAGRLQTGLSLEHQGVAFVTFGKDGRTHVGESALMNHAGALAGAANWSARP